MPVYRVQVVNPLEIYEFEPGLVARIVESAEKPFGVVFPESRVSAWYMRTEVMPVGLMADDVLDFDFVPEIFTFMVDPAGEQLAEEASKRR